MPNDEHDWIPIAWWDKRTQSVRAMYFYQKELIEHIKRINVIVEKGEK